MKLAMIFDLDGTLIDTPSGIVETFTATLKSMDVACDDVAAIRGTIGLPLEQAFSHLLRVSLDDKKVAQAVKQYQALFREIVLPKAQALIFPRVEDGLCVLKDQGVALAVATSKVYKSAEALLKAANLWDYFNLVVGADQVTQPKPHPEMGHLVMKNLGVTADEAVMVGDTTHDMMMARDAGMRSIAVTYGIHPIQKLKSVQPTWIVDSFDGVMDCVLKVNK